MFVKLRGPVKFTQNYGKFERSEVEPMTMKESISDPELIHTAYTGSVTTVLKSLDLAEPTESEAGQASPLTPNQRPQMDWTIELSGNTLSRLYDAACEVTNPELEPRSVKQTPFKVLSAWAQSSRHAERDTDSPSKAMEVLSMAAAERNDPEILRTPVDDGIDSLFNDYHNLNETPIPPCDN